MNKNENPRPIQAVFFYAGILGILTGMGSITKGIAEKNPDAVSFGSLSLVVGLGMFLMALK